MGPCLEFGKISRLFGSSRWEDSLFANNGARLSGFYLYLPPQCGCYPVSGPVFPTLQAAPKQQLMHLSYSFGPCLFQRNFSCDLTSLQLCEPGLWDSSAINNGNQMRVMGLAHWVLHVAWKPSLWALDHLISLIFCRCTIHSGPHLLICMHCPNNRRWDLQYKSNHVTVLPSPQMFFIEVMKYLKTVDR